MALAPDIMFLQVKKQVQLPLNNNRRSFSSIGAMHANKNKWGCNERKEIKVDEWMD
jgi:hypothetical protein